MRTDVKLGMVTSMVVVLAAGGYFLFRGDSQAPIPIVDKTLPNGAKSATKPPAGKQPVNVPSRQVNASKDAPARTGLPVNRDPRLTAKPADRPPVSPPRERTPVTQPSAEPFAERPPEPAPDAPTLSPVVAAPSDSVVKAAGEPDAGHTSRTLAAGGDPVRPAPTTPADASALIAPPAAPPVVAAIPPAASVPSEPKPEPAKVAVDTHRVQSGDSYASLAQTYYGNAKYAKFLAESNPAVSDPAKLPLGSTIKIPPLPSDFEARMANGPAPATKPLPKAAAGKRTYTVKSGDSFYKIAKDQLGNAERWKELLDLNKSLVHGDPTALQPGQTLVLPD